MLFKSTNLEDTKFLSRFVFTEPKTSDQGDVPDYVEIVLGSKALVERGLTALA